MPWVRFTADHDHRPTRRVIHAFKAGMERNVTRACAAHALQLGRAVRIAAPKTKAEAQATVEGS